MNFKAVMGGVSILLTLVAYGIYLWQTAKHPNIKPHPFSWLLWGVVTGVAYLVQFAEGAGPGSWVMGLTSIVCVVIGVISLLKDQWSFSRFDWITVSAATIVFVYYLLSKHPTQSAVLATLVDVLGYGPTIRKGWRRPYDDSISSFSLNSAKFVPSLFAMNAYSIATCVYPATLVLMNGAVAAMLQLRRLQLRRTHNSPSRSELN